MSLPNSTRNLAKRPGIYLSFLACEARTEAGALQRALAASRGLTVFCDARRHQDEHRAEDAKAAIHNADLVVILGTKMYGQRSSEVFSTHEELRYIFEARKRVLVVSMCKRYKYKRTHHMISLLSHTTLKWQPQLAATRHFARVEPPAFLTEAIAESAEDSTLMHERVTACVSEQKQLLGVPAPKEAGHPTTGEEATHMLTSPGRGENSVGSSSRWRRRECTLLCPASAEVMATTEDDIDARLSAIAVNVDNIQAQASAFGTLVSRMLERGPTLVVSRLLASQSSIDAIFRAMRMHLHNTLLQRCGLYILKHVIAVMAPTCPRDIELPPCLAFSAIHERRPSVDSGASDNSLPRVMEEGAALAVLLMNMHPGDETLQKHGVQIVELVTNHGPEGRAHALELKANAAITLAMQAHKRSSRIQLCGRVALDSIDHYRKEEAFN